MLVHSGPLGLAHLLLYVEPMPFGRVGSEDCAVLESKCGCLPVVI